MNSGEHNLSKDKQSLHPSSTKKVLAFDPSFSAFGWVLIDGTNQTYGVIKKRKGETPITFSMRLALELAPLIAQANIVVSEKPYGSKSSRALEALSFCKGLIIGLCVEKPLFFYSAVSCKKAATGDSNADKNKIVQWAFSNYPNIMGKIKSKYAQEAISDALTVYNRFTLSEDNK